MDTGWIFNNVGAIIGGFVVVIVAYFVFKPKSNINQLEKDSKASVSKVDRKNEAEKAAMIPQEAVSDKQISPVWKTRRYILNKIRSLKKPDILSGKHHDDIINTTDKNEEQIPSPLNSPVADLTGVPLEVHEKNLETTAIEEVANDIPEISVPVDAGDTPPISSELDNTNVYELNDNSNSPEIDMNTVPPADETGDENTQLEATAIKNEQISEKPEGRGNLLNLFTDEAEEESEISKFAANLDPVDVNNLRKEAENIQKHIRR